MALRTALLRWLALPAPLRAMAPVAVMAALWWSSSVPPSRRPPNVVRELLHNGAHVVAYALLAGALLLARSHRHLASPHQARPAAILAAVVAAAYGAIDEWHQSWVGRVSSFGDLLADASGAALAVVWLSVGLCGDAAARRLAPWCAGSCIASVAVATFVGW